MDVFPFLNPAAIALVAAIFLFSYYSLTKKSEPPKGQKPPEPAGAWPIIGHLPVLSRTQPLHLTLGAIADKVGPIFTLRLGMREDLVLNSWELVKEAFTAKDVALSNRPLITSAQHLGYNLAAFGFAPYGAYWRELRKIASIELMSSRRLEQLMPVKLGELEISIKELYKIWEDEKNPCGSARVELKRWLEELNLNLILMMIAGKRFFGGSGVGDHEEDGKQWLKAMREFFHYLGMVVLRDVVPFLGWADVSGHEKAMKRTAKDFDEILQRWLEEHKENRKLGQHKEDKDFMDIMISILNGKQIAGYAADTITKATCMNIIVGASDTVVVVTTWAISLLLNNRHALKRAQEELDEFVGRERRVNDSDISKLIYLQAIVKETLRLYPPAPLAVHRQASEDCSIKGYHVKKGNWVMVNLWKVHTDPRVWTDPLEFKPERFLTTHKDVDVKGQNFELIPFGSGRRMCPGLSFGRQMVRLILACFLQAFEISTLKDLAVDMTENIGITNLKMTPLDLLILPRLSPHLYT